MSQPHRDTGFTLIEIMVVIALVSLLTALGAGGYKSWAVAHAQLGAATDMQTILRQTQVRAVTEGVPFCVKFDTTAKTYTVYRHACDTAATIPLVKVSGPFDLGDSRIAMTGVQFHAPDGSVGAQMTFRASGSAWPGGLTITRSGSTKAYSLVVEGLTGRVSLT